MRVTRFLDSFSGHNKWQTEIITILHHHSSNNMEICKLFFQDLFEFKMAAMDQINNFEGFRPIVY